MRPAIWITKGACAEHGEGVGEGDLGRHEGARALVRLELVCIKGRVWEREIEGAMRAPVRLEPM